MKKVYVITQGKDAFCLLEILRDLGVVHLEHVRSPAGSSIDALKQNFKVLTNTIEILGKGPEQGAVLDLPDWQNTAQEILELEDVILRLNAELLVLEGKIDLWASWGNFEPKDVAELAKKGIYIHLCEISQKDFKTIPVQMVLGVVANKKSVVRCVIASPQAKVPYHTVALPDMSLAAMQELAKIQKAQLEKVQQQLNAQRQYRQAFVRILGAVKAELDFQEALAGMGEDGKISYLKGFCPVEQCGKVQAVVEQHQGVVSIQDPDADDKVPTFLRNSKFVEFVKPVFEFMSIIPGYREADVSFCFLAFFSVFFGMLIGDAGYGAVFALMALYFHRKMKNKLTDPTVFYLVYFLSGCAVVWGILTGTVFGVSLFGNVFKPVFPWLVNEKNVQLLCFTIGAVHLTIAHIWRGLRKLPSFLAIADAGWVTIVWVAYFYAQQFILSTPVPGFVNFAAVCAFVVIVLFSQTFDDIRKDVGGFATNVLLTVLTVVSTLIDVISYIRLYAVGTAGLALAEAFNQMALSAGFHNLFLGIGAILILIAGHTLNILLGIMAVMVHGLRLNILEFSGHLSLEWVGVHYNPFRKFEHKVN